MQQQQQQQLYSTSQKLDRSIRRGKSSRQSCPIFWPLVFPSVFPLWINYREIAGKMACHAPRRAVGLEIDSMGHVGVDLYQPGPIKQKTRVRNAPLVHGRLRCTKGAVSRSLTTVRPAPGGGRGRGETEKRLLCE